MVAPASVESWLRCTVLCEETAVSCAAWADIVALADVGGDTVAVAGSGFPDASSVIVTISVRVSKLVDVPSESAVRAEVWW